MPARTNWTSSGHLRSLRITSTKNINMFKQSYDTIYKYIYAKKDSSVNEIILSTSGGPSQRRWCLYMDNEYELQQQYIMYVTRNDMHLNVVFQTSRVRRSTQKTNHQSNDIKQNNAKLPQYYQLQIRHTLNILLYYYKTKLQYF